MINTSWLRLSLIKCNEYCFLFPSLFFFHHPMHISSSKQSTDDWQQFCNRQASKQTNKQIKKKIYKSIFFNAEAWMLIVECNFANRFTTFRSRLPLFSLNVRKNSFFSMQNCVCLLEKLEMALNSTDCLFWLKNFWMVRV